MRKITTLRKLRSTITLILILFCFSAYSQVGIGNTNPNVDALLEVGDGTDTEGLLIPRVPLTATTSPSPMSTDVAGMIVYNTATAGDVTPGFYYNDGTDWIRINPAMSDDWTTTGNAGTTPGTNFLGTTDNVHLELFSNNTSRMRIEDDGQITMGFGAAAANTDEQFNAVSTYTNGVGVGGYSGGSGIGVYGQNISSGYGVYGLNNSTGIGVYGTNSSNGQGVRGYNSGTGWGVGGRAISSSGIGMVAYNTNSTGAGLIASGANAALSYLASTGATMNGTRGGAAFSTSSTGTGLTGTGNNDNTSYSLTAGAGLGGAGDTGVYGLSTSSTGTGIIGVGNNNGTITTHASASGIAGTGSSIGVFGYAGEGDDINGNRGNAGAEFVLDGDNDPTTNSTDAESNRARAILAGFDNVQPFGTSSARDSYFGGYFSGGNENGGGQTYAYVGMRYRIGNNGTSGGSTTDYKIIGTGTVSTLFNDSNGLQRTMFAPETPEILFQDFGVGQLTNGTARVDLDPILKGALHIDSEHPLKVYVTLEGECNGIYVTDKSADGFTVKELNGGTSNVSFSWQIVANRADTKDRNGRMISKHVGIRLPIGPGPLTSELNKVESSNISSKTMKKEDSLDLNSSTTSNNSEGKIFKSVLSNKGN